MPAYDYRCDDCGVVQELVQSIHKLLPESLPCPKCGCDSFHVFLVAPGVLTVGMDHRSIDVAIGKDAEIRWEQIEKRKARRDKLRKESGEQALTATGRDEYKPIKGAKLTPVAAPEPKEQ